MLGQAPVLLLNIVLDWKEFKTTNTLAYYENPSIKAVIRYLIALYLCALNLTLPKILDKGISLLQSITH